MKQTLILGSGSPSRKALLDKLHIEYECVSPDIDETPLPHETVETMVERLAREKARKVAQTHPEALIIGADQVAMLDGKIFGKPGTHENATAQLKALSGHRVTFYTAMCLLNAPKNHEHVVIEPFYVTFRSLSDEQIEAYLQKEQPYHCAASFKSEGLGIVLTESFEGRDPNALIGLPLIQLTGLLAKEGRCILTN